MNNHFPQQPEAITTPPAKSKSNKMLLIIIGLLLLIIMVLISVILYMAFKNRRLDGTLPNSLPTITQTPSPTTSTTPTTSTPSPTATPTNELVETKTFSRTIVSVYDISTQISGQIPLDAAAELINTGGVNTNAAELKISGDDFSIRIFDPGEAENTELSEFKEINNPNITPLYRTTSKTSGEIRYTNNLWTDQKDCKAYGSPISVPCGYNGIVIENEKEEAAAIVFFVCSGDVEKCDLVMSSIKITSK